MRRSLFPRSLCSAGPAPVGALALAALVGCGGSHAEVTGSVNGIPFGDTKYVYFGDPFVAISNVEVDCVDLDWVRRSYEAGSQPTTLEMQLLQFAWADGIVEGNRPVDVSAAVSATVVKSDASHFESMRAQAGTMNVTVYEEEKLVEGEFTDVLFEDGGTLSGTFTAEWCRNLRDP